MRIGSRWDARTVYQEEAAKRSAREFDLRLFRVALVEKQRSAEDLNDHGARGRAELVSDVVAVVRAFRPDADLHELVLLDGVDDRSGDAIRSAVLSDLNDGLEVMTERAEVAALLSSEVQPKAFRGEGECPRLHTTRAPPNQGPERLDVERRAIGG